MHDTLNVVKQRKTSTKTSRQADSPWLNAERAAEYVGMSRRFVYEEVRRGRMRAAKLGGRGEIVTRKEWLDEYIVNRAKPIELKKP